MFIRGTVQLAYVRQPLVLPQGTVYALWLADNLRGDHRFVAIRAPDVFDRGGHLLSLTAELGAGSVVVVAADDQIMCALQIVRLVVVNPFLGVAA